MCVHFESPRKMSRHSFKTIEISSVLLIFDLLFFLKLALKINTIYLHNSVTDNSSVLSTVFLSEGNL